MPHSSLRLAFAGAIVLAAFSGCESTRTLRVAPENPTGFSQDADGTVVLRSEKKNSVAVRIARERGTADTASMPALTVFVTNGGKNPLAVGPEDIVAVTGDNQPIPVLGRSAVAARLQREIPSSGPGPYNSSTSISSSSSSSRDSGSFPREMSNNSPIYNEPFPVAPGAPGSSSSSTSHSRSEPAPVGDARLGKFLAPLLVRSEIPPGQTGGGTVKLDPAQVPTGAPVRVTVAVGGERHEFAFTLQ